MVYGTYAGSILVEYLAQVQASQLGTEGTAWSQLAFDQFIEVTLIPAAENFVDAYCNHSFGTAGKGFQHGTFTFDGNGKQVLFLPPKYCPMLGIGGGSIDGTTISPITDIHAHDQYLEYYNGNWNQGCKNVVLYGSYGYTTLPKDITYVTAQLCANILADMMRRKVAPDLFSSVMAGGGDAGALFAMAEVFTPSLKRMLDPYKITWIDFG